MLNRIPIEPPKIVLDKIKALWDVDPIEGKVRSKASGVEIGFIDAGRVFITVNITNHPKKVIKKVKRAHVIWWFAMGEWPKLEIDHRNRDSTDDRLDNLRESTSRENCINIDRCDRELPTGVYKSPRQGWYYSSVFVNGKQKYLGSFATVEQAVEVRNKALMENFRC